MYIFLWVFCHTNHYSAAYMSSGFCGPANILFLGVANADVRTLIFAG
jgi:hypothetical protein